MKSALFIFENANQIFWNNVFGRYYSVCPSVIIVSAQKLHKSMQIEFALENLNCGCQI